MRIRHLTVFSAVLSCVAGSFPDYPFKPATEYADVVTKSGIAVAVVPMEDPQEQHKYFGTDMRSKGYLPVFLVIENQTSTDSFLLRKEGLSYSPAGRSGPNLPNPASPSKGDKAVAVASYIPYYGIVATVMASKTKEIKQNLLKSALQSTTLSPGASAHGFIFVPTHSGHSSRDKIHLVIPFARSGSDETVRVDLAF